VINKNYCYTVLWHSVSLATYTAVFPKHSSAKHRYGFRETFQISLEITRKFLSGDLHYRRKTPYLFVMFSLFEFLGKRKINSRVFSTEKKLGNTDLQHYNRVVRALVTYSLCCHVYNVLRASCNEHCNDEPAA